MDSADPMQVDGQDRRFTANSAVGGLDCPNPDAEIPGNVERVVTCTGARIRVEMGNGALGVVEEEEGKAVRAVPSRVSDDEVLKAAGTEGSADGGGVKGCMPTGEGCRGGGRSGGGSGGDDRVGVGSGGSAGDAEAVARRARWLRLIMVPVKEEADDTDVESRVGFGSGEKKRKAMDEGLVPTKKEVEIKVESGIGCATGDNKWGNEGRNDGVIDVKPMNWAEPVVKLEREELKPRYVSRRARALKSTGEEGSDGKVSSLEDVEDGDFTVEPDWYLVGQSVVTGLSTAKGNKLVDNEIVHFSFPSGSMSYRSNGNWIVRFSTTRYGEVIVWCFLDISCRITVIRVISV